VSRPIDDRLCWSTIGGLALIHVAAVIGVVWIIVNPSMPTVVLTVVRWMLLVFGAAAFQNSALSWSVDHRAHHADTDGASDPHAVTHGAWHAHVGWLFRRRQASADVTRLRDLWAVGSIRLQHRCYPVVAIAIGLALPTAITATWGDPWGGLFVAGFLRTAVMLQATFAVNSLAHLVGTRRYDPQSSARDSLFTAVVTFGEGYHSFHHRFPFDYRNGARWWHYDPSKWLIWSLARLHLAGTLRTASPATIARAAAGDRASQEQAPRRLEFSTSGPATDRRRRRGRSRRGAHPRTPGITTRRAR
jgi:fatty-acid desaturase